MSLATTAQELISRFTQDTRLLKLTTPLGASRMLVECVRAEEGLSQGFALRIAALSTDAEIPLKTLIGQPALLELAIVGGAGWRPFHGHITQVELSGANGGFARYHLIVEPWTAFLGHTRDSRIFQDMTVPDIIDAVFKRYQGQGKLAPAWRFDLRDRTIYPRRSYTTQYQESDLAFVERLLLDEGLFYYFEHSGDAASSSLGQHVLTIADHNGSFRPNAQGIVRFTQPGAVMKEDSIDRWRSEAVLQTNAVDISSWDYRALDTRPALAATADAAFMQLASRDTPGIYAYPTREHGMRIANRQMEALEARQHVHVGAGTVRTLAPGTTFTLTDHAELDAGTDDERTFLVVRAVHLMHNNLRAEMRASVDQSLGRSPLDSDGQRPLYRNRIDTIRSSIPYRSRGADGRGHLLHPKSTVYGQQSAIVVGPAGAMVHTDRDHRIKVQFHWQRGDASQSRLSHPAPDGHVGAPADDTSGTWVRVATGVAGANWGSHAVPRIGQEVLVDFIEGDIDRPVVVGALYNGKGQPDAQYNQFSQGAGAATGNAPAWFPGQAGAHAHPAALSGIKTQAMAGSQAGAAAYNQLVFDDNPGQSRTVLQQHAGAHKGSAELNLGHLRHQTDNQRLDAVGFGAELKTEFSAALRAGQGLLLSADARNGASGSQLDSKEAQAQIERSHQLQVSLATTAQAHNGKLKDEQEKQEPEPVKLPAIAQQGHSAEVIGKTESGAGKDKVAAFGEPQLQLSSPAGIAATTPADAIFSAGNTSSIVAGQDINFASQGGAFHTVKAGISLFTYGKASNKEKPNQETGIKLHAASGKVSSQSQSDETKITADKVVTVASITKTVTIAAKQHALLTAQGAYIKLEGGNIMLNGPGKIEFKASVKEIAGPTSSSVCLPRFPNGELSLNQTKHHTYAAQYQVIRGETKLAHQPYLLTLPDGTKYFGETDLGGKTIKVGTSEPKPVELTLINKNSWDQENVNVWHQEMDKYWD
ncbi:MAG: type VI secretion system tip protein TssI/VgrG [Pseudomonadota bacterium]